MIEWEEKKLGVCWRWVWGDGGGSADDGVFLGIRCVCEIRKTNEFILGERREKVTRRREQWPFWTVQAVGSTKK